MAEVIERSEGTYEELGTVTVRDKAIIGEDGVSVSYKLKTTKAKADEPNPDRVWIPADPGKQENKEACFQEHFMNGQLRGGVREDDGSMAKVPKGVLPKGNQYVPCDECGHKFTIADIRKLI